MNWFDELSAPVQMTFIRAAFLLGIGFLGLIAFMVVKKVRFKVGTKGIELDADGDPTNNDAAEVDKK